MGLPGLSQQPRQAGNLSAARGAAGWMRRLKAHTAVRKALAAGQVPESRARQMCDWTDRLPAGHREAADTILLAAATCGATLADLAILATDVYERARPSSRIRMRTRALLTGGVAGGHHRRRRAADRRLDPGQHRRAASAHPLRPARSSRGSHRPAWGRREILDQGSSYPNPGEGSRSGATDSHPHEQLTAAICQGGPRPGAMPFT
jgi:hypothetical protein